MADSDKSQSFLKKSRVLPRGKLSTRSRQRLANRLQELMKDRGDLSVRDLAKLCEMSASSVALIVSGEIDPKLSTLLKLANALQLGSVEELLGPLGTQTFIDDEAGVGER